MSAGDLRIEAVTKRFGDFTAVDGIDVASPPPPCDRCATNNRDEARYCKGCGGRLARQLRPRLGRGSWRL